MKPSAARRHRVSRHTSPEIDESCDEIKQAAYLPGGSIDLEDLCGRGIDPLLLLLLRQLLHQLLVDGDLWLELEDCSGGRVPLCVVLADAFSGQAPQLNLLILPQLHYQDALGPETCKKTSV